MIIDNIELNLIKSESEDVLSVFSEIGNTSCSEQRYNITRMNRNVWTEENTNVRRAK